MSSAGFVGISLVDSLHEVRLFDLLLLHLCVHRPEASLAASGQQTPVIVIAMDQPERYLLIDGYRRVRALEQLGRDTCGG